VSKLNDSSEAQVFIEGFKRLHDFGLNFCESQNIEHLTGKNRNAK
jgi:hypothetical protein